MRALWIGLAVFSVLCGIASGFLAAVVGTWAALLMLAGCAGLVAATVRLRPEDGFRVAAILLGVVVPFVSMVSAPTAWLAVTGEPADCVLVDERAGRYDSKGTPHVYEFDCAGERFTITEKADTYTTEIGDRVELVLDRNRLTGPGFPTAPANLAIVALFLTFVVGVSYIVALLGLPLRPPPKQRLPDQIGPVGGRRG